MASTPAPISSTTSITSITSTTDDLKRCFDPVVDTKTRVLILGSLPGERSLASAQYYGNPQNKFWQLVSDVFAINLVALTYPERLATLLENGIGLWDVVAQAKRNGSLDSNIRHHTQNDLPGLASQLPHLQTIAFNGATAERLGLKVLQQKANAYRLIRLESSSPAHTLAYTEKLLSWQQLKD